MLSFIIPLRHPDSAKNWPNVCARLVETATSIDACCRGFQNSAIVVANEEASLPDLPSSVRVLRVSYPPPSVSIFRGESDSEQRRRAVWLDKGRKIAAGAISARSAGATYIMPVDADDLVSVQIPAYVQANAGKPGWFVDKGWLLPVDSKLGVILHDFHNWCGTYVIVRLDLLPLGDSVDSTDPAVICSWLGHHRDLLPALAERGHLLQPLPFPAAVYRIGHSDNNFQRGSLVSEVFSWPKLKKNPRQFVRQLMHLRPFIGAQQTSFTGQERSSVKARVTEH